MRYWPCAFIAVAAGLAGCGQKRIEKLEEGIATEADVRRQFGEPAAVYHEAGGVRTFEYARQPEGQTNCMITIGADGKMSALRQVLKATEFARVSAGLDKAPVRRLLGRPALTQRCELKQQQAWDWRWHDGVQAKVFVVTFDVDRRVTGTSVIDDPTAVMPGAR